MSELDDILERLKQVNTLLEEIPEGAEIFAKIRAGSISAEDATLLLMEVAAKHNLLESLIAASEEIKTLVPSFQSSILRFCGLPFTMLRIAGCT